jgi:hypothetical protein
MAAGEVIVQVHGQSPLEINDVNPQDDPSRKLHAQEGGSRIRSRPLCRIRSHLLGSPEKFNDRFGRTPIGSISLLAVCSAVDARGIPMLEELPGTGAYLNAPERIKRVNHTFQV